MASCRIPTPPNRQAKPRTPRSRRAPTTEGKVFSYVVRVDSGFAPNPYHGCCTLACCKPSLRRTASVGDLIVGLSPRSERIVYAMTVSEVLTFEEYWKGARFVDKRPRAGDHRDAVGDNIYEPTRSGWKQHPSCHSKRGGAQDEGAMHHDLGGQNVLVSDDFVYFGADGPKLPATLGFLAVGRGHRCRFEPNERTKVQRWFTRQRKGRVGEPAFPSPRWMTTS